LSALAGLSDLLGAVLAAPHAVEPRLAYAAACGSERAQFIRLQLEAQRLARAGRPSGAGPRAKPNAFSSNTITGFDGRARFRHACGGSRSTAASSEHIQIDAATFVATAEELSRLAPVRRLILDWRPACDR
jgi:uncharacterized protein (TIGR02996 family)